MSLFDAQRAYSAKEDLGAGGHSYWRADIAGLYSHQVAGRGLELISRPLALADQHPAPQNSVSARPAAMAGYWYRSLGFSGENTPDPQHFAACAFPESYPSSGRLTLIVSDAGSVFAKDLGPAGGVDIYPEDPLQQGWKRIE